MPEPSLREEIERAFEQISRAQEAQKKADPLFTSRTAPAAVRSFVTRIVIWVWAAYVAGLAIFIALGGAIATGDKISTLFEILKIAILPVVTFAIGHYFGSKSE
jgi:hypothetical protein